MKAYEALYLCVEPFLMHPLYPRVRRRCRSLVRAAVEQPRLLDGGGRKSPYTVGVPVRVSISELPRKTTVQEQMHLGLTPDMARAVEARRSNVEAVVRRASGAKFVRYQKDTYARHA